MLHRRLAYGLLLASVLTLYLFDNNTGTRILLVLCVSLPALSALTLVFPRATLTAALLLPDAATRGETVSGELSLAASPRVSLSLTAVFRLENRMTGETTELSRVLRLQRGACSDRFAISAAHCGVLNLSLTELRTFDPLRLFSRRFPVSAAAGIAILPKRRALTVSLIPSADDLQDSSRYAADRPGSDPSETFRIREYVPGDPIRQIHWKLSEKTDKTLVRDFGLPIVEQLLLAVEHGGFGAAAPQPEEMDALLDLLVSAANSLLRQELPFTLGWQTQGTWTAREIAAQEDLVEALHSLLRVPLESGECSAIACFEAAQAPRAYAHVAVFSCDPPPALGQLARGCRVTLLTPLAHAEELPVLENEVVLLPFSDETDWIEL